MAGVGSWAEGLAIKSYFLIWIPTRGGSLNSGLTMEVDGSKLSHSVDSSGM